MKMIQKKMSMQIEIMDRIAFSVVSSTCVKELKKAHPEWDGRAIKRNARSRFKKRPWPPATTSAIISTLDQARRSKDSGKRSIPMGPSIQNSKSKRNAVGVLLS